MNAHAQHQPARGVLPIFLGVRSKRVLLILIGSLLWWNMGSPRPVMADQQHAPKPYDANGRRDPFVSLVREGRLVSPVGVPSSAARPSDLLLVGILWDPAAHSLALINDTEAKVGDTIGAYEVMEIRRDAVVLMRDGKPLVLQISFEDHPNPGE